MKQLHTDNLEPIEFTMACKMVPGSYVKLIKSLSQTGILTCFSLNRAMIKIKTLVTWQLTVHKRDHIHHHKSSVNVCMLHLPNLLVRIPHPLPVSQVR